MVEGYGLAGLYVCYLHESLLKIIHQVTPVFHFGWTFVLVGGSRNVLTAVGTSAELQRLLLCNYG